MAFDVQFTGDAEKHYNALDANMTQRVDRAIDQLAQNPFVGPNISKLRGEYAGEYRYRVGSYRMVYNVDTERQMCMITSIYRRGRAYRR